MRILLVEDDPMIGEGVVDGLSAEGYAVDWVQDGNSALIALRTTPFSLVILDLGLPGRDGISVLHEVRSQKIHTPVLVTTARDTVADRVAGLDAGADDYVLKPFHMSELLARMRAVLRRRPGAASAATRTLTNGELTLDTETKIVTIERDGEKRQAALSRREYDLLEALLTRPGAILSRAALEERVYSDGELPESNAIEFIIHGLRKKLGASAIGNVRGLGWMVQRPRAS